MSKEVSLACHSSSPLSSGTNNALPEPSDTFGLLYSGFGSTGNLKPSKSWFPWKTKLQALDKSFGMFHPSSSLCKYKRRRCLLCLASSSKARLECMMLKLFTNTISPGCKAISRDNRFAAMSRTSRAFICEAESGLVPSLASPARPCSGLRSKLRMILSSWKKSNGRRAVGGFPGLPQILSKLARLIGVILPTSELATVGR